ncbi:DUF4041 domain-containing protein [Lawsonibacter hominis]|uniref:DUF4041 domain-containing protein n=1 Tax=Lawsonibacter hominis TaxID=2763053 RepID=A0A8J6J716_9FIRM|nr:DUF4041 domain-containing protein [Lawsonibacter hominis]MBC5733976.1 DUF4041 domain-containing protein [Lawsonibacter hominis]
MAFFILLAILFLILWLVERNKTKAYGNLKAEKEAADSYVASKQSEGNELFESKRREALDYYQKKTKSADERVKAAGLEVERLDKEKADLQQELLILNQDVLCAMVSVDDYANLKSDEIKNKLTLLKSQEDELIKSEKALEVTNTSSLKRVVDSQKKQILRCFNAEVTSVIGTITANNIDSVRTKLQRTFDALNKIFAVDGVQISQEYFAMKLEEMSLVYAYMLKVEEEKEQKKAIREQMLEEEKVRREIEREKQKIEKEESQFSNEVKKLMGYMQKAKDDVEKQLYIDKIQELEEKLKALAADKENVLEREQNTRAGFVYIISNIGSFGESVYKIGMTRRLEPMDRINELSSASVPFPFDVHALIFSEDAPSLETLLHHHFQDQQVNKVNPRKEFFRVDLESIKQLIIENHNSTVQFVDIPDATEYRETLRIESTQQNESSASS